MKSSYVKSSLIANENIVVIGKLHWATFLGVVFNALLGLLLVRDAAFSALGGWILFFAFIQFTHSLILYTQTEFALTDRRIIAKTGGLYRRSSLELLLNKVESIQVKQSIPARMLGYGHIVVTGSGGTKEKFPFISSAMNMRKEINLQIATSV